MFRWFLWLIFLRIYSYLPTCLSPPLPCHRHLFVFASTIGTGRKPTGMQGKVPKPQPLERKLGFCELGESFVDLCLVAWEWWWWQYIGDWKGYSMRQHRNVQKIWYGRCPIILTVYGHLIHYGFNYCWPCNSTSVNFATVFRSALFWHGIYIHACIALHYNTLD